jgi:phosphoribosyl-ATP pyrophosphohydrolase
VIIPSIDLKQGNAVQLIGGKVQALDAGDPRPIMERFRLAGEVAVVDLDAALGDGDNTDVIRELCRMGPCRVGGGIRSVEAARAWLDAGARKVVLGTAAHPEILRELPRDRVVAALDADHGEVVVEGWRKHTGHTVQERMAELRPYVGGFLVTFVEREGRLAGIDLEAAKELVGVAGDARLTVAGGVATAREIAELDRLGADAQVGMALYKDEISLSQAIAAPLRSDRPDGLWPTVVVDAHGKALGLAYSNHESLHAAVDWRRGVYWSRKHGLWEKGMTSGAVQELLRIDLDCDRDAMRFTVRQEPPGFCHEETWSCWGPDAGLPALARRLAGRVREAPAGSYTRRLLDDPAMLAAKLREEAAELATAEGREAVVHEAADVIYFALVALSRSGGSLEDVERELDMRALRLTRRPGDAKPTPGDGEARP